MNYSWGMRIATATGVIMLATVACVGSSGSGDGAATTPNPLVSPAPTVDSQTKRIVDKLLELSSRVEYLERNLRGAGGTGPIAGTDLESRVSALESQVSLGSGFGSGGLESRVSRMESSVSSLESQVGYGLGLRAGGLESRVSSLERTVSSLESQVGYGFGR
jgi:hypothetical protein